MTDLTDIPGLDVGEEVEEPEGPTGPKPEGEYHCEITDVDIDDSKSYGKRMEIEYTILAPEKYANGDKLWHGINIEHTSERAHSIAIDEFKSVCWAAGLDVIPDESSKLIGKELFVTMEHREYTFEGEDRIAEDVSYVNPVDGQPQGPFDEQPDHDDADTSADIGSDIDDDSPFF